MFKEFCRVLRHRYSQGVVHGVQVHAGAPPRATKNNFFLDIFVGMRQNGAEFGEVHPPQMS